MNPTSPKTYMVIKAVLSSLEFTQLGIHKKTDVSIGQINSVTHWLLSRNFIEKTTRRYSVIDPAGIISIFPLFRSMKELLIKTIPVRGSTGDIIDNTPKGSVLCLDSALERYSPYLRTDRVCIYSRDIKKVTEVFAPYSGGKTVLHIYKPDMEFETDIVKDKIEITTKLRTVIDLACDNKIYAAKDLFKELWGLEIG
ncbi:MAG: hypothetical protein QMC85_05565 [Methanocellales archaeon]|nr:hypothetical protein [Methanocellales archaeon]MDI6902190.1 hypothetical protein [Methanocellales archaeon]